jgi:DnaK suppressor protein
VDKDPPAPHRSQAHGGPLQEGRLLAERAAAQAQIEALTRSFDDVVAASQSSNADDEHDPEGSTIAYERAQLTAVLAATRGRLAELDEALARLTLGVYGICERCSRPIPAGRLAVRPFARTCVTCA